MFKLRGEGGRRERTVVSCVQGKMSDLRKRRMSKCNLRSMSEKVEK